MGRMLIQSAVDFNLEIWVLDPDPQAPCHQLASKFVNGPITDFETVVNFGQSCDLVTIEIENVNTDALKYLESKGIWCTNDGLTKPIVVHCRKAVDDLLPIFRAAPFDPSRYVFHCFSETADDARTILDFDAWISFTGIVTFKNAAEVAEAAKLVPADRIMVETDAPFLSPEPMRKMFPNEPKNVVHTARFIAQLRGVDPVDFEQQLDANAERFFSISSTV